MSDRQSTPSAREQWLHVALAVARDGMPQPRDFEVRDRSNEYDDARVELTFDDSAPAAEWAGRLGLSAQHRGLVSNDGKRAISTWSGRRTDGWRWTVCAYTPLTATPAPVAESLADQVTSAIEAQAHIHVTSDDRRYEVSIDETGRAYDLRGGPVSSNVWKCPVTYCVYRIVDGPIDVGDEPTSVLIAQHLEDHRAGA